MRQYVVAHWKGELGLARSFLLNFVAGYVVLVALLLLTAQRFQSDVGTNALAHVHLVVGMIVFVAWFVWALVGVSRSALKILRDKQQQPIRKGFAVLALVIVAAVIVLTANDLRRFLL